MAITPFHGADRSFDRMFDGWPNLPFEWNDRGELLEREDAYVYVLDLPGVDRSDVDLHFDDHALSVSVEQTAGDEYTSRRRSVRERVQVPGSVDESAISATLKNGVLEVTMPTVERENHGTSIPIEE